jgi:hypothetical protein
MFPDLLEPVGLHVHEGDGLNHAEADQEYVRLPVGGVGKNQGSFFLKKPSGFFGFFLFFFVFFVFLYICPEERVFRVFSVSRILLGDSRLSIKITLTN